MKCLLVVFSIIALAFGQEDPVCLSTALAMSDAIACNTELAGLVTPSDLATFCDSACGSTLRSAYSDCGYTGSNNPIIAACDAIPTSGPGGEDPVCLATALSMSNAATCATELATATTPSGIATFCASPCADTIRSAYSDCGYTTNTNNPVMTICGGSVPTGATDDIPFTLPTLSVEQLECIANESLNNTNVMTCSTAFQAIATQSDVSNLCGLSCYADFRDAFVGCGVSASFFDDTLCGDDGGAVHTVAMTMMVVIGVIAALFM